MKRFYFLAILFVTVITMSGGTACFADAVTEHPAYLQALPELRLAGAYLDKFTPSNELNQELINTITEISAAAKEINLAGISDGKDFESHSQIEATINKAESYHEALKLLVKISKDITGTEKNDFADDLMKRVLGHIDTAIKNVESILAYSGFPGKHPAYLHALTDLRLAREYLDKITPDVALDNNELNAIGEINGAMDDINTAAIDDSKDIASFREVDVDLQRTSRYGKALELLNKTYEDIRREEVNGFAQSSQKQALRHINNAISIVKRAVK